MTRAGAPGVLFERRRNPAPIAPLRTDVALFVGLAQRGPVDRPVAVQSYRDFLAAFGPPLPTAFLAHTVRAFFENGGERAMVVRCLSLDPERGAEAASTDVPTLNGEALILAASSKGSWGDQLSVSIREGRRATAMASVGAFDRNGAQIADIDGFAHGTQVRIIQPGSAPQYRIVSMVDVDQGQLAWVHPEPQLSLPTDRALSVLDRSRPLSIERLSYDILVFERHRLIERYRDCSFSSRSERFVEHVIAETAPALVDEEGEVRQSLARLKVIVPPPDIMPPVPDLSVTNGIPLSGGRDGLATLHIDDLVGPVAANAPLRGMQVTNDLDDVSIISIPDLMGRPRSIPEPVDPPPYEPCDPCAGPPPEPVSSPPLHDVPPGFTNSQIRLAQQRLVSWCERLGDRIAVLDPPPSSFEEAAGIGGISAWRSHFDSSYAALYFPWVAIPDPEAEGGLRDIPPSGHVCGQMARIDLANGVHHPPANVPLRFAQKANWRVETNAHEFLNDRQINVLASRAGAGVRVHGARTLSSDKSWLFLNVRRLVIMVKKAARLGSAWTAFEPNNEATRKRLAASLSGFLAGLWRRGAFMGASAGEAFQVRCDHSNNPPEARTNGRLQADIAIAPVKPLEYIVVRLGRSDGAIEISERAEGIAA